MYGQVDTTPAASRPLRLWPGFVAATVLLFGFIAPLGFPALAMSGILAAVAGSVVILAWWLFFSRAPLPERLAALLCMALALAVTRPFLDRSIVTGAMGALGFVLPIPLMCLALVVWAAGTRGSGAAIRRASLPLAMLLACVFATLLRTDGVGGQRVLNLQWRWTPSAEDLLLAAAESDPLPPAAIVAEPASLNDPEPPVVTPTDTGKETVVPAPSQPEWPGFRGPERNGIVRGVRISTDWMHSPPAEMWRRKIGPGWSSFAVAGDFLYTQEQRGDDEIVACYRVSTGEPVWGHRDPVRFWESNAGAGPRGTPTLGDGRVYALGATGMLNVLDARTGALVWSRNAAADTGVEVPTWGFSSSPLLAGEVVIVATSGTLAGYRRTDGEPLWIGQNNGFSYSSPHLLTIDGVEQAVLVSGATTSVTPSDGKVLWQHTWEGGAIVQPGVIAEGDILVNSIWFTGGVGVRRLVINRADGGWDVRELWTSSGLKPYFNDFVVHNGHAFGFDNSILAAISLEDGARKWKGGRYGSGQMLLLADQDVLLVLSEEGELALVSATPDKFKELARAPGIEGKTWNHPVLIRDVLLIRNGEEMAAFRLKTE